MTAARRGAVPALLLALAVSACSRPSPATGRPVFQPQSAAFELPFGGEASEDFRLPVAAGTSLTVAGAVDPDLRVEALPPAPGTGPGLRIHASGRRVGVRVGTLYAVAHPGPGQPIPLLYALRVRGTLTVVPTNPLVDLRAEDPAAVLTVRDTLPGFAVTAAEITAGPFAARVSRDPTGAYQVRVTAVIQKFRPGDRGASGTLLIRSTDSVEPRKEIPLFAFGRVP